MKSKALAAATVVLLTAAMGVTFAAPSQAGMTVHSQDETVTAPAGSASAYAGPL
jgi:hypothetical protein